MLFYSVCEPIVSLKKMFITPMKPSMNRLVYFLILRKSKLIGYEII